MRKIEVVKKRSIWGYLGDDWVAFLKIILSDPRSVPKVRDESSHLHSISTHPDLLDLAITSL